jgi:hypothetical protein
VPHKSIQEYTAVTVPGTPGCFWTFYTTDDGTQKKTLHNRRRYTTEYVTQQKMLHNRRRYTTGDVTQEKTLHKKKRAALVLVPRGVLEDELLVVGQSFRQEAHSKGSGPQPCKDPQGSGGGYCLRHRDGQKAHPGPQPLDRPEPCQLERVPGPLGPPALSGTRPPSP